VIDNEERWQYNYFNYFTEIEEHFQKVRGTGLFLLSPLDWALIESWKNTGIPLEAVLRGIDAAFEKWRSRKSRIRMINSVAYCTQAVMEEAQAMEGMVPPPSAKQAAPPFSLDELRTHLTASAASLRALEPYQSIGAAVEQLAADAESHFQDLEQLEQRLTALEDKMLSIARAQQSEESLFAARRELSLQLRLYRGKLTADQLAMLERQYLDRKLFDSAGLPRLSLFYLR
jgi:hypothetical protein